ncbi:MAG: hypothetical protein A3K19_28870 [Lentisphaerae bacterium RIFOXYB12_FULL_65_16]|nr:MAG: hypothetical protein A3K18_25455 [Lentisphaerae bacterium RIFOXYA12_64_32]OGV88307.1 MAG: hypothetical protein A3K19_28870 [Lentisphaerae bacterium RIFOXYB12_FULL_65_16]
MNTKLTLRMEDGLVRQAKREARRRGKSVSQMVAEYFRSLARRPDSGGTLPPVTASLMGVLKGRGLSEPDHKRHLREKYL